MKKALLTSAVAAILVLTDLGGLAQRNSMMNGAAMSPGKTVFENVSTSPNLTTLTDAVKAAELAETLGNAGPFTIFAPTNDAFAKLPAGTPAYLLRADHKDTLAKILTYHIVAGRIGSRQLASMIKKGNGKVTLKTVQGEDLTASLLNGRILLTDAKGGMAIVTTADIPQVNGVIYLIDTVLLP